MPPASETTAAARARVVAARAHQRRSAMSIADSTALAGVGFDVLCEVVGAVSVVNTQGGFYTSGLNTVGPHQTYTTSPASAVVGVPASFTTRKNAFGTALRRLRDEARTLGADGVVAIRIESSAHAVGASHVDTLNVVVHGVAVRARRRHVTGAPFTTSMSGVQVAAALRGGLVPVTFLRVPVMGIRRRDLSPFSSGRQFTPVGEIAWLTDLVTVCRHRAREEFTRTAARAGGDTTVVDSLTLHIHDDRLSAEHATAEVVVTGTALARFALPAARPSALTMLSLTDRPEPR